MRKHHLHPILFAVYPVLFLFAHNVDELFLSELWIPLGASLAGTGIIWILAHLAVRNFGKSALVSSVLTLGILIYGHLVPATGHTISTGDIPWFPVRLSTGPLLAALYLLGLAGLVGLAARRKPLPLIHRGITLVALVLLLFPAVKITRAFYGNSLSPGPPAAVERTASPPSTRSRGGDDASGVPHRRPNIYYLIVDGYPAAETLRKNYGENIDGFVNFLEDRGFYVVPDGRSNYPKTQQSIASSLNMNYLDRLARPPYATKKFKRLIQNNRVARILTSKGYNLVRCNATINAFRNWRPPPDYVITRSDFNARADEVSLPYFNLVFYRGYINNFSLMVLRTSAFRVFLANDVEDRKRQLTLAALRGLGNVHRRVPSPRFVVCHILPPHPPYFWDERGRLLENPRVPRNLRKRWLQHDRYLGQLRYITRRLQRTIRALLKHSETDPIIVVQSDHGSGAVKLSDRWSILNAIRLPGGSRELHPDITPVNTFRTVLNHLFDAGLKPLPDRRYILLSPDHVPVDSLPIEQAEFGMYDEPTGETIRRVERWHREGKHAEAPP